MNLLPLSKLGAYEKADNRVQFGLYLPKVSPRQGNRVWVKLIHEQDQFLQKIQPRLFELSYAPDDTDRDYWSTEITIDPADKPDSDSAWGKPGRYVYRFVLRNPDVHQDIDWIIDPFAANSEWGSSQPSPWGINPTNGAATKQIGGLPN